MRPHSSFGIKICVYWSIVQLLIVLSVSRSIAQSAALINSVADQLQNHSFTLREQPNHSGILHVQVGTNAYTCEIGTGALFPLPTDLDDVTVSKVNMDSDAEILVKRSATGKIADRNSANDVVVNYQFVRISLKHKLLGNGMVLITREDGQLPQSSSDVLAALGYVLKGKGLPEPKLYVGSLLSKIVHYIPSGHADLSSTNAELFESADRALSEGYKPCPLCFNKLTRLPYLGTELSLGKEAEATVRHYYEISPSVEMQKRVARIGRDVLENWPSKLKGYNYRFSVVDDSRVNAVACPGGYIFINRGLIESMESDDELEAVLAHEIAHVELRHGLMEYLKAQRGARNAMLFASLVTLGTGAAAAASGNRDATEIASAGGAVSLLLAGVASHLAVAGYEKNHEQEADIFALIYMQHRGKGKDALVSVLKKLRTNAEIEQSISGEKSNDPTHPDLKERLFAAQTLEVRPFTQTFDAMNNNGERVYSLALHAQAAYRRRDGHKVLIVLGEVSAMPALGETKKFDSLRFVQNNGSVILKTDESVTINALDTLSVSFSASESISGFIHEGFLPKVDGIAADRIIERK